MKDATGELSMTAVAVVAIAAVAVIFRSFVWPQIQSSLLRSTMCTSAYNCTGSGTLSCSYLHNNGVVEQISCQEKR